MDIPVVCANCGATDSIHEYGEIEVGTFEASRRVKRLVWETSQNGLVVELDPNVEWEEPNLFDLEDDYRAQGFACSDCGKTADTIAELAKPKYGVDQWGRVLDADGIPNGPMQLPKEQLKLEV